MDTMNSYKIIFNRFTKKFYLETDTIIRSNMGLLLNLELDSTEEYPLPNPDLPLTDLVVVISYYFGTFTHVTKNIFKH